MYSLNIPYQTPSFFPVQDAVSIFLKFRFRHRHWKIILTFFSCDFTIVAADVFTYSEFVYRFQALKLNLVEYFRFTNCCGKANKKRISWHSETRLDTDCLLMSQ